MCFPGAGGRGPAAFACGAPVVQAAAFGRSELLGWLPRDIESFMEQPLFHLGALAVTPWFLVKAAAYLLLIGAIARATRLFLARRVLPRTSMEPGHQYVLARWVEYLVFCIGLIVGLQSSGLNLNSLLVVGGALGIGVGFGLQNIANNFISGLILLIEQPVRVGHIVEVGGLQGRVIRIGARSTSLRTGANSIIIVPNSEFVSGRVTNWTAGGTRVLVGAKIGVGYGSDPDKVRTILLGVARQHPEALAEPGPAVLFEGFGDSALAFELYAWFPGTVMDAGGYRSTLNFEIFRALKENGIEVPFPQRDLHIRTVDEPLPVRASP